MQKLPSSSRFPQLRSGATAAGFRKDGQPIGRLVFEPLSSASDALYGAVGGSNYQGQGLKLSKHFRPWREA